MNTLHTMKLKLTKNTLLSALIGLSLLIQACGGGSEKDVSEEVIGETPTPNSQAISSAQKQFYINTITNEKLAEISDEDEQLIVSLGASNLFGELKRTDKRKYVDQNDQLKYTVKYKEDGIKLNDGNEALLWKIKLYDDHIKISDNNEMENSFRIGLSESAKIKVKQNDEEVAALRLRSNDAFIAVKEKYTVHNFGNSLALGVLLIDEIPEAEKFMLCAELLKQGK
ncbi:MAG: hypothetical protein AAF149_20505 [Bacteroidota bacterium]